MKIIIILLIFISFAKISVSQINNDLIIEQIEKMNDNNEEEINENDFVELIETYWQLTENPININSDEIDQLIEYHFINIFQIEKIKEYRKNFGDFQFIDELKVIEGLDEMTLQIIQPLITFQSIDKQDKLILKNILKYGKHQVIMQLDQSLNKKKGYEAVPDSILYEKPSSKYLGSPQKLYFRYNYSYRDLIEAGFCIEKDPGEYIFKNKINDSIKKLLDDKMYNYFDFYSFHLCLRNIYFVKTLALGDYQLSLGQGLTLGSGLSFESSGSSLLRKSKKIRASKSANESRYLRGIATTLNYKNFELSLFYSNKKVDANVSVCDIESGEPIQVTSLQQSGLHRTYNELIDKKTIRQQLYGANLTYNISNFGIGYSIHKTDLSAELIPEPTMYNQFYFKGKSLMVQGVDFYYILKKFAFYGECARSENGGLAAMLGTTIQPSGYAEFTILYRNYAKDFQNLYSNAFSAGSYPRNEKGWYLASSMSLAPNWKLIASADLYKSDWLRSLTYAPSYDNEFNVQLNHQINSNALIFFQFRAKDKLKNTSNIEIFERYLIHNKSKMFRFHISYPVGNDFIFKNRAEYHVCQGENDKSFGYLIYQDINYNPEEKPYSFSFRYALFNSDGVIVYAYENDVLYSFSISGMSHKGMRIYFVGKIKMFKKIQISGKIACTIYDDVKEIGSNLEMIEGNVKADAKIQIIWKI